MKTPGNRKWRGREAGTGPGGGWEEGEVQGPSRGRPGMASPVNAQCPRPSLQLVFQSGEWGQGWGAGGDQDQEPNSVLFSMIN